MKYRITTVRDAENGRILYWRAEYKKGFFYPWKVLRTGNAEGKYSTLDVAVSVIAQHNLQNEFDEKVAFTEEFV